MKGIRYIALILAAVLCLELPRNAMAKNETVPQYSFSGTASVSGTAASFGEGGLSWLYRDRLSNLSREMFDSAEEDPETGLTMTYDYVIGEADEASLGQMFENVLIPAMENALTAYKYDYPEKMTYSTSHMTFRAFNTYENGEPLLNKKGENVLRVIGFFDRGNYGKEEILTEIKETVDQAVAGFTGKDRYSLLVQIHDWLLNSGTYDYDAVPVLDFGSKTFWYAHEASGILLLGKGVCESYAKAFKIFCDRLNIPCMIVSSDTHSWNYVLMPNGKWYMVDATWDDTFGEGGGDSARLFLAPNKPFYDRDHVPSVLPSGLPETDTEYYTPGAEEEPEGHTFGETLIKAHVKAPTAEQKGSYELFRRCETCGQEQLMEKWETVLLPDGALQGDLNRDGQVNDKDALYLLSYVFFGESNPVDQYADLNEDGFITDQDALYLLGYCFFPKDNPLPEKERLLYRRDPSAGEADSPEVEEELYDRDILY